MTRKILAFLLLLTSFNVAIAQNKYGYSINKEGKIYFENTIPVEGTQIKLFKRALQFIGTEDFGRIVEVATHYKSKQRNTVLIKDPITYQDADEGKIFGNGFIPFQYRGHDYFFITFNYRIYVKDNEYRYIFTNFIVKEFLDAGSASVKEMGRNTGNYGSDGRTNNFPLEDFIYRMAYDRSHPFFMEQIKNLKHNLKLAMTGEL